MNRPAALPSSAESQAPVLFRRGGAGVERQALHEAVALLRARLQRHRGSDASQNPAIVLMCQRHGSFMAGLAAALLERRRLLLPSDATARTLRQLQEDHAPVLYLTDAPAATVPGPSLQLETAWPEARRRAEPLRLPDAAALHLFTSGSTGRPVAHRKSWCELLAGVGAWRRLLKLPGDTGSIVATVPPQHMYGMEASVVLPLALPGLCVFDGRPFYPEDVRAALAALPEPRVLVTTPVHLGVLSRAAVALPRLHCIVSATAPLSRDLAQLAETRFDAPLHEVYGSTETGMIATRRTVRGERWTPRPDVALRIHPDGTASVAMPGAPERQPLNDYLEPLPGGFAIAGRTGDLVNVAGKRASLSGLETILKEIPGVRDGALFLPEQGTGTEVPRPIAFVVAPGLTPQIVRQRLRAHMPAGFAPRQVVMLDALPRNPVGKLPRSALQSLYRRHAGGLAGPASS